MSDGFFTSVVPDDDHKPPDIDTSVAHQARAVRFLAAEAGIRQFLDIGRG